MSAVAGTATNCVPLIVTSDACSPSHPIFGTNIRKVRPYILCSSTTLLGQSTDPFASLHNEYDNCYDDSRPYTPQTTPNIINVNR